MSVDSTCIMMVTYNRLELTKRALKSLFDINNTKGGYRLIIVDNGSTDGTVEYLRELKEQCNVVWDVQFNENNMGIAVARNQCLKLAQKYDTQWLSTVDNDVEFLPNWLEDSIKILKALPKFCVGINFEGTPYPITDKNGVTFQYKKMGNLGTACTVFSQELHKAIGYFTTEFGLYGEEDADFFFRARLAGYQMAYLKDMGTHFGEGELDQGPYREFKTACHNNNLAKFRQNCYEYAHKKRALYIPFE